jgi:hypothetical protein
MLRVEFVIFIALPVRNYLMVLNRLRLANVPQTFETLQVIPPGGAKIDFPVRIAQTRSARNHPRRIANGTQMSHSLQ